MGDIVDDAEVHGGLIALLDRTGQRDGGQRVVQNKQRYWVWVSGGIAAAFILSLALWEPRSHEGNNQPDVPFQSADEQAVRHFEHGWGLFLAGRYKGVEAALDEVQQRDPGQPMVCLLRFLVRRTSGRDPGDALTPPCLVAEDSTADLLRIIEQESQGWRAIEPQLRAFLDQHQNHLLGLLYVGTNDLWATLDERIDVLDEVLIREESAVVAVAAKAQLFIEHGRLEEAWAAADYGLQMHGEAPVLIAAQGRIQLQRGEIEAARQTLSRALSKQPDLLDAQADLATVNDTTSRPADP
ncbi:MAG: hypothetical protein HN348_11380 [Proteobacteria bacterium]|nr:hypothetical protein [Pseudomonadota bacterium]